MGLGTIIGKLLYGIFVVVVMVPAALFAFLLFYVFVPYLGVESLGDPAHYVFAPFCVAIGMFLWVHLAHKLNDIWGIRRIGAYLVYISLVLGLYFAYLATCRAVFLPDMQILTLAEAELGNTWVSAFYAVAGVLVLALFGKSLYRGIQTVRAIEHLETTSPSGVTYGLCEVKGELMVEGTFRLYSPLEHRACAAWWEYESRRKDEGLYWHCVKSNHLDLFCGDGHRRLRIDFDQATFSGGAWVDQGHRAEKSFSPGDAIYVFGEARMDPTRPGRLVLTADPDSPISLLVSTRSEEDVHASRSVACLSDLAWTLCSAAATLFLLLPFLDLAGVPFLAFSALLPTGILVLGLLLLYVNDLVILRNIALRNRGNIAVSLRKREDLLPNLEQVVTAHLKHERRVHEQVAQLRRLFRAKLEEDPEAFRSYCDAEARTFAAVVTVLEGRPPLKAAEAVQSLMAAWAAMENEIAWMKTAYNRAVTQYLNRRDRFPDRLIAFGLRLKRLDYLETDLHEHALPEFHAP